MSLSSLRFNNADIVKFDSADDGKSGVLTAIVRHEGVLKYQQPGGGYRGELVTREFNRKLDSNGLPLVRAIAGAPATNEHIPVQFDGATPVLEPSLQVGRVREDGVHVYKDGRVQVTMDVDDEPTIQEILSGKKKGLSLAYMCNTERKDGIHNGKPYQYIQTDPLQVHHVAIVDNPRAPEATFLNFKFDSAEAADIAWQVDSDETPKHVDSASAVVPTQTGKKPMAYTVTVGGRPITLDSADDAEALNGLIAKADSLQAKLDAKKKSSEMDDEDDEDMEDGGDDEDMEDKSGKPLPAFIRKKMKAKNDAIAELTDRIDSLTADIDTKDGELAILQAIVSRADAENTDEEHTDAADLEAEVQARLDSIFEAYNDAKEFLPEDFKLDGQSTVASIQAAAIAKFDPEIKLDSEEAIAGAYTAMKRWPRRDSSSSQVREMALSTVAPVDRADAMPKKAAKKPLTFMKKSKGAY